MLDAFRFVCSGLYRWINTAKISTEILYSLSFCLSCAQICSSSSVSCSSITRCDVQDSSALHFFVCLCGVKLYYLIICWRYRRKRCSLRPASPSQHFPAALNWKTLKSIVCICIYCGFVLAELWPSLNYHGHKHNVTVYSNNLGGIRRTLSRSVFSFSPVGYRSCWRWTRPYLRREGAPLISSSVEITTTVNRNNGKQMFYFSTVEFWCQWNILLYTLCSNISLLFWMSSPSGNDSIHKTFTIKNDYTGFKTAPKDQNISDLYNNFWFNLLKLS